MCILTCTGSLDALDCSIAVMAKSTMTVRSEIGFSLKCVVCLGIVEAVTHLEPKLMVE